ncbi:MAG: phage virion morphogenesis protein [Holophagales bacterium]|jgi:phage virion morphogenesis protein|nr:phage virion morphogenesis protein [Holophagales bacterium]
MPDGIQIKVELNAEAAAGSLANLLGYIESGKLMEDVGTEVAQYSQHRILSGDNTAPDGSLWAALSPSTLKAKAAKGFGDKGTLIQRNSLYKAIMPGNATKDHVEVGSSLAYALIHQFGGKAGKGRKVTIPARPYIGLSAQEKANLEQDVADWIRAKLAGGK